MTATKMRSTAVGYTLLAPSLFGVVTFLLLRMLVVAWLSLHRWDLLGPIRYVGPSNWRSVLADSSFATSLLVTALFIAIVVPTQSVLGLMAAAILARNMPGSGFFRTLYVLPWICAPLAIAVLAAQRVYFDYWARRGVDVGPFFAALDGPRIPAPGGPGFPAGYQALRPYFDEMFLGRADVPTTLGAAQAAANAAAQR